jgi:hypothetical protein
LGQEHPAGLLQSLEDGDDDVVCDRIRVIEHGERSAGGADDAVDGCDELADRFAVADAPGRERAGGRRRRIPVGLRR